MKILFILFFFNLNPVVGCIFLEKNQFKSSKNLNSSLSQNGDQSNSSASFIIEVNIFSSCIYLMLIICKFIYKLVSFYKKKVKALQLKKLRKMMKMIY